MQVSITTVVVSPVPDFCCRRMVWLQMMCSNRASLLWELIRPENPNRFLFEMTSQMTDPSRWMATQAAIVLPTLIGSTRQYMMKGVPSFL